VLRPFLGVGRGCGSPLEHCIDEVRKESPATLLEVFFPRRFQWSFPLCLYRHPEHEGRLQKFPKKRIIS